MAEMFDTICDAVEEKLGDVIRIQCAGDLVIVRPKDTTIPAFVIYPEMQDTLYPILKRKPDALKRLLLTMKPKEPRSFPPLTPEEEEEMDCEFGAYSWPNPYDYESDWDDDD